MKKKSPNILLILNDDMGWSDIGCYGSEIATPVLDRLANHGLRYTQFYNTARCCPSRASLLTGLHPHQADVGDMVGNDDIDGYLGDLSQNAATIAEVMKGNGYRTMMSGKWHVTGQISGERKENWPCQRGFDSFYGMLAGAASYFDPHTLMRGNTFLETPQGDFYFTDAISDEAVAQLDAHYTEADRPFFQYVAYTAPHWPLHAREEDVAKYKGYYDEGWDALRETRLAKLRSLGLLDEKMAMSARDPESESWDGVQHKEWEAQRMEVYAAQIDRMDQGIGRIVSRIEAAGELENTLIIFLADNGGCAEIIRPHHKENIVSRGSARATTRDGREVRFGNVPEVIPGPEDTYASYGLPWANASNTPFRKFKCWVHEGGISTPFIVHWPEGISEENGLRHPPAQLPDVMATILDVSGAVYPERIGDREIKPHEGFSLVPSFSGGPHGREILTWEHEGNCGIRIGAWKLVREFGSEWELYNVEEDRAEMQNFADIETEKVKELVAEWQRWADRCGVIPREELLAERKNKK